MAGATSPSEFRELLDRTLRAVDSDEGAGAVVRATGLRMRLQITDLDLVLDIAPSEGDEHHLSWSFSEEPDWEPELQLRMDSATANAYLQGKASIAVAIARGRVRCRGDARTTLRYLPALKRFGEPYKRLVAADYPHLSLD